MCTFQPYMSVKLNKQISGRNVRESGAQSAVLLPREDPLIRNQYTTISKGLLYLLSKFDCPPESSEDASHRVKPPCNPVPCGGPGGITIIVFVTTRSRLSTSTEDEYVTLFQIFKSSVIQINSCTLESMLQNPNFIAKHRGIYMAN